jgi:uncharacterized protein (DUF58 family)
VTTDGPDRNNGDAQAQAESREAPGARIAIFSWYGIGAALAAVAGGAWFGMTAPVILGALVAGTGLVARGWAAICLWGVVAERSLDGARAFPGDALSITIALDNGKPLPLSWIRARQSVPEGLHPVPAESRAQDDTAIEATVEGAALTVETALGPYRRVTLSRSLLCERRGYYPLTPLTVESADVFGLFLRRRTEGPGKSGTDAVIVYPRLYPVTDFGLPARHPLGPNRDPRRLFEDPGRPAGIREYDGNTPFKAIAWKASARTGMLQAKIFEPTVTLEVSLCLAVDGFTPGDAFEAAVSLAASLLHAELAERRAVGLYANGVQTPGLGPVELPAGRQPGHEMAALEGLARLQPQPAVPFADFLSRVLARMGLGATLVVIAASPEPALLARLTQLTQRGRPVVLLLAGEGEVPTLPFACRRITAAVSGVAA